MKYKKYYLLVLILTVFIGCNKAYAKEVKDVCYYDSPKFKAQLTIYTGAGTNDGFTEISVNKVGDTPETNSENINNWIPDGLTINTTEGGFEFPDLYSSKSDANQNGKCPEYIVFQYNDNWWFFDTYRVWGTNSLSDAKTAVDGINQQENSVGFYATYKNSDGSKITEEEYWEEFQSPDVGGHSADVDCNSLFGDRNDPDSLASIIDEILGYVRIIVPILVILLGTIDLARAVISSKEEDMKKAQATFTKRLIVGVCVFLVPVLIDAIMWLADIVWEGLGYSMCEF